MPIQKNITRTITFQSLKTDGTANTATTPTCTVSKDGAAEAPAANAPSNLGNGRWSIVLTAAEMNADVVSLVAYGTGLVPAQRDIFTEADYTAARSVKLDQLDVAISTRSTYAGGDTAGTTTLLSLLTAPRAAKLDNLDVLVSSRLATASYSVPPAANVIGAAVWADAVGVVVKASTDRIPLSPSAVGSTMQIDLAQVVPPVDVTSLPTMNVGHCLAAARAEAAGAESVVGTTYSKKNPDGSAFRTFTLNSASDPTSRS